MFSVVGVLCGLRGKHRTGAAGSLWLWVQDYQQLEDLLTLVL